MAEKRMFTQKIIDSDAFLDMPLSSQALYFHLNMRADDDGFVNNPKRIQRTIGASEDDLKLLIVKRFVIGFESGVIVIKHWKMHNTLKKDRYNPTQYQEELQTLALKENKSYTEKTGDNLATTWQPNGNHLEPQRNHNGTITEPQYSIDKYRLVENREDILSSSDEQECSKSEIYKTIITYLNEKAGTSYKPTTKKTKEVIQARINEGFTIEDFKTVIDKKCSDWLNSEFEQYLRPSTLFGTKFESYLNSPVKQKQQTQTETPDFLKKWSV